MTSNLTSPRDEIRRTGFFQACCFFLWLVLLLYSRTGVASQISSLPVVPADAQEAWLVTFGPGEIYFERFGHNAIWLREPARGLDHTFNFGYFDFEQEDFFLRFMRGRMLYFSVAQPASREFDYYRQDKRSIRIQKLDLNPSQYQRLRDHLLNGIQPENRNYRYDYYLDNCSTRIRDALDVALAGALHERAGQTPAKLNFRDHTRRLTEMQFWYYLGLEIALGLPVDRPISRWEEMFIPMVVADEIAGMSAIPAGTGRSLVEMDSMLYVSTLPAPGETPAPVWYRYLAFGLALTAVAWLSGRLMPPLWLTALCRAWILVSATMGLVLAALWFLTDHQASGDNANLLLLNPLVILALLPGLRRPGAIMMVVGNLLAFVLLILPVSQYNLDVLAAFAPVNLAVAFYLYRSGIVSDRKKILLG